MLELSIKLEQKVGPKNVGPKKVRAKKLTYLYISLPNSDIIQLNSNINATTKQKKSNRL